jgi:hypothetical protein
MILSVSGPMRLAIRGIRSLAFAQNACRSAIDGDTGTEPNVAMCSALTLPATRRVDSRLAWRRLATCRNLTNIEIPQWFKW